MMLDNLLNALFPAGHDTQVEAEGILCGTAQYGQDKTATSLAWSTARRSGRGRAVACGTRLEVIRHSPGRPIAVLIDAQSQRMRRRDEMLGLTNTLHI